VEIVGDSGAPLPSGEFGEIAVTGGRNPYLPLLRYRTGDFAALDPRPVPAETPPRDWSASTAATSSSSAPPTTPWSTGGLGRVLRDHLFIQHRFIQRADRSLDLTIRPFPNAPINLDSIRRGILALFGEVELRIQLDNNLGEENQGGKVTAYLSEVE